MNNKTQNIIYSEYEATDTFEYFLRFYCEDNSIIINESNCETFDFIKDKFHFDVEFDNCFILVKKINDEVYFKQFLNILDNRICNKIFKTNVNNIRDEFIHNYCDHNFKDKQKKAISLKLENDIIITDLHNNKINFKYNDTEDYIIYDCYFNKNSFNIEELNIKIFMFNNFFYCSVQNCYNKFSCDLLNKLDYIFGYIFNIYYLSDGSLYTGKRTIERIRENFYNMMKYINDVKISDKIKKIIYNNILFLFNQMMEFSFDFEKLIKYDNKEIETYLLKMFISVLSNKVCRLYGYKNKYVLLHSLYNENKNNFSEEFKNIIKRKIIKYNLTKKYKDMLEY